IEQAKVPLPDQRGQAVYAFYADTTPDGRTWYSMGIESGPLSVSDKSTTGGAVELPNGFIEQAKVPLPDQRGQAVYAFYADTTPDGRTWYS
ncbi:hypothetical protein CTI14_64175, partial [Methylobacterium radiotolerans]